MVARRHSLQSLSDDDVGRLSTVGLRRLHRGRVAVLAGAVALVIVGWPLSEHVSELSRRRYDPDPGVAAAAKSAFGAWHVASLGSSAATTLLAGAALAMAARLPSSNGTDSSRG